MRKKHIVSKLKCTTLLFLAALLLFPPSSLPGVSTTVHAAAKNPLKYKNKRILKGESFRLYDGTAKTVSFCSATPSVASVTKRGKVTGKKAGTAVITAKIGKKKYRCKVTVFDTVDLILFAGQSNMTGRGDASLAPALTDGAGYECKVVTDISHLNPIAEPFGLGQDSASMQDGKLRTGSLVTAFVNEYFKQTQVPIVGVSATVVGSGRVSWSTIHYKEAARRLNKAQKALKKKKLKIRHVYVVYMQGENDGFAGSTAEEYADSLKLFYRNLSKNTDVEACLLIRIGRYTKEPALYDQVLQAQTQLCRKNKNFVLVSTKAATLPDSSYQEDGLHLTQRGLNVIGAEAGKNAGKYVRTGKEPRIRDDKYDNIYVPAAK